MQLRTACLCGLLLTTQGAADEVSLNVATYDDWSVFEAEGPRECWVSSAVASMERSDGSTVTFDAGDPPLFMVFFRPQESRFGEAAFFDPSRTMGPDADGQLTVGGNAFSVRSRDEWAWPVFASEDGRVLRVLAGAETATLSIEARGGGDVLFRFSLSGWAAAVTDAAVRCGLGT